MASRSLGTLTLDLIARIGGWRAGMDQAARIADNKTREMERSFGRLGGVLKSVLGGLSVGLVVHKIIEETNKAQQAMAQLTAVVKSTGGAAGLTVKQLVDMSSAIQDTTTFSDEAAQAAEIVFLQFGKLGSNDIKRALQASADLAARFGGTMEEAAFKIAKATSGDSKGLRGLKSFGITFGKIETDVIAKMVKFNDVAGVQKLILDRIAGAAPGAAAAKLGTLGGAIEQLKNKFGDLFELKTSETAGLVTAINALAFNLEAVARVAIRAAAAYAIFRAGLVAVEVIKAVASFTSLFSAIASGNKIFIGAATAQDLNAVSKYALAEATAVETAAEVARTEQMVLGTRATYARVVADEASMATAGTRATVTRNLAGSEKALVEAQAANALAQGKMAAQAKDAIVAQERLAFQSTKLGGALSLILTPFRGIAAFAVANPFTAIAIGIGVATVALTAFSDKIKLSKDGVVTLGNASEATFQLISEGFSKIDFEKFFEDLATSLVTFSQLGRDIFTVVEALKSLGVNAENAGGVLKRAFLELPGIKQTAILLALLAKPLAAIEERARKIADETAKAAAAAEAAGVPGVPKPDDKVGDPAALEKIKEMVATLREQNTTLEKGAVAAITESIATGKLAKVFKEAGVDANQYKQILIDLTAKHEAAEKAAKKQQDVEQARKKIKDLITDLKVQVATYGQGKLAAVAYDLAHGQLAEDLKLTGDAAGKTADEVFDLNKELENKILGESLRDINIQIAELRGNTKDAILLKFDAQYAELMERAIAANNTELVNALNTLRDLAPAQEEFNRLRAEAGVITDNLATNEERYRISNETGAIGEFEMLQKVGAERGKTVMQLQEILVKMEAIAKASGNPILLANVEAFRVEIEKLSSETNLLAQKFETVLKESFSNFIGAVLDGTGTLKDAFKGLVDDLRQRLNKLIADKLVEKLFGSVSEGGGWLSWLFTAGAAAAGGSNVNGNVFSGAGGHGYASGGHVSAGSMALVGERGPERVLFGSSANIVPNDKLGGTTINNYMDNRGASVELIKALPGILDERDRRLVAGLRDAKSRGKF